MTGYPLVDIDRFAQMYATQRRGGSLSPDLLHLDGSMLYSEKNSDYGGSWRLAGKTLSLWLQEMGCSELTISTDEETMTSLGLYFQRFHKLARAFNGEFLADELNNESIFDSHHDEATYAEMHASLFSDDQELERIEQLLEIDVEDLGE